MLMLNVFKLFLFNKEGKFNIKNILKCFIIAAILGAIAYLIYDYHELSVQSIAKDEIINQEKNNNIMLNKTVSDLQKTVSELKASADVTAKQLQTLQTQYDSIQTNYTASNTVVTTKIKRITADTTIKPEDKSKNINKVLIDDLNDFYNNDSTGGKNE